MDGQDQFSKLPEPLLLHILSMLEMKDVVKTSVLAKSWKNLWTQVHNIVYENLPVNSDWHNFYENWERMERVASFIDHTLMLCTAKIDTFALSLSGFYDISAVIDKWIDHVLEKKVEMLRLDISRFNTPRLYQNSTLTKLELINCLDCSSCPVSWPSLKSLRLESVRLNDKSMDKILMGCPKLENLVIVDIKNQFLRNINVTSPSVRKLVLSNIWYETHDEILDTVADIDVLKVRAPWLQELEISDKIITTKFQLLDVCSLMKATLTLSTCVYKEFQFALETDEQYVERNDRLARYNDMWIDMVTRLLGNLSYVAELIIGSHPIQVLSLSILLSQPSPLFKCKHLSIETPLWKFDLPGIICLLENTPHLETLHIKVLDEQQDVRPLYQTKKLFQDGDPHLSMPYGKILHLKNVKIDYWRCSCRGDTFKTYGECFDFELVEYILRSVSVLEKLVLCSSGGSCFYSCPVPNCAFLYVPRLSSKLIATVLNDDAAEWELKKSKNKSVFTFPVYAPLHPTLS